MAKRKGHKELQDLLDATAVLSNVPPPVQTRQQVLPLGEITWENFERLAARLIAGDGAVYDCYRYGKPGEYQSGIDVFARQLVDGRIERWAYQCKRHESFTQDDVKKAVKSFKFPADHFVILLSTTASTTVRDAARAFPNTYVWDDEDISRRLKNHPLIVEDFFSRQWREAFFGNSFKSPPESVQESLKRLIGLNLNHQEWLHSNLLPVLQMPEKIYGAPLPLNTPTVLSAGEVASIPPLKEAMKKAWTYADLKSQKFSRLLGCDPREVETRTIDNWLIWQRQRNWALELFYKYLQVKCLALGMAYDADHRRFYFTPENGGTRVKSYRAFRRQAKRKVAYPYYDKKSGELRFWVHHAVRLSFVEFDKEFYFKVEPGYAFTKNGTEFLASEDIGPLATRRKSGERNQNVFNHIIFWSEMLSVPGGNIVIDCSGQQLIISKMYESGKANFGIPADSAPLDEIAMEEDELDLELLTEIIDEEESEL